MKRALGCVCLLLLSCSSSNNANNDGTGGGAGSNTTGGARKWYCTGPNSAVCSCDAFPPDTMVFGGSPSEHCVDYPCCLLTETADPLFATCECNYPTASCSAEAASKPGTAIVSQCPPAPEDKVTTKCAAQDVNCRWDYLRSNGFDGCCAGTICKPNTAAIPVCQTATAEESTLLAQCKVDARSSDIRKMTVANPQVLTSAGTLTFQTADCTLATFGPNGCLSSVTLTLQGAASGCRLDIDVDVVGGKLVVTRVFASWGDCPGFSPLTGGTVVLADNPTTVDFTMSSIACDNGLIIESYVRSGTFDVHFREGVLDSVTFSDQHLVFQGFFTGSLSASAACPTQ